jgi:hypothetical protein
MKPLLNTVSLWFGIVMVLVVTAWAIALASSDFMSDMLYGKKRVAFIFVLLAYALYRCFRIYQVRKQVKHEEK